MDAPDIGTALPYGAMTRKTERPSWPGVRRAFEGFCRILLRHWCPLSVDGHEALPKVPFILCSNHSSHLDSIALMIAADGSFDSFALLAARDYFFTGSPVRRLFRSLLTLVEI